MMEFRDKRLFYFVHVMINVHRPTSGVSHFEKVIFMGRYDSQSSSSKAIKKLVDKDFVWFFTFMMQYGEELNDAFSFPMSHKGVKLIRGAPSLTELKIG
jgi:hypothetical protein